jgi:FAD binding domain-containing protein
METLAASDRVGPGDPRYDTLVRRGFNKRLLGQPDYIRIVSSTEQVIEALQDAMREKLRIAVRSGGHCLEGFVADPAVRAVIDTSLMTGVSYDPEMNAFAVEAVRRWARSTEGCSWDGESPFPPARAPRSGPVGTCWVAPSAFCAGSTDWRPTTCAA